MNSMAQQGGNTLKRVAQTPIRFIGFSPRSDADFESASRWLSAVQMMRIILDSRFVILDLKSIFALHQPPSNEFDGSTR